MILKFTFLRLDGTFNVTGAGQAPNNVIDYVVVAGGRWSRWISQGGGGGAGGFREGLFFYPYVEPNPLMSCVQV